MAPSEPDNLSSVDGVDCGWGMETSNKSYKEVTHKSDFHIYCNRYGTMELLGDVKGKRVLDLPSGPGVYARQFLERGAAHVTSVDILPSFILDCKREVMNAKVETPLEKWTGIAADACECTQFPGGPFDVIVANFMIENFSEADTMIRVLKNIYENLKPGGRYVGLFAPGAHFPRERQIILDTVGMSTTDATHVKLFDKVSIEYSVNKANRTFKWHYLTQEVIKDLMEKAGFAEVEFRRLLVDPQYKGSQDLDLFVNTTSNRHILARKPS